MANPYYYPTNYQYFNPYQPQVQQTAQQQAPQIQNGGFVRVKNEKEVIDYPLAPGYTMTFIDESATHCYTKTASFNQFEKPRIDKYRLVKEDVENQPAEEKKAPSIDLSAYALKAEIEPLLSEISALKKRVDALTEGGKEDA